MNTFLGDSLPDRTLLKRPTETEEILSELHVEGRNKQNELIEGNSWLKNGHPLGAARHMDWKLFGLLTADAFIAGTPLEGFTANQSTSYFHAFMENLLETADTDPDKYAFLAKYRSQLEKFQEEMAAAKEIDANINKIARAGMNLSDEKRNKLIDDYAEELLEMFKTKKIGWIPCGWVTKNGESHAMMARVNMKGSVSIVNTGSGTMQNHPMIKVTSKDPLTGELKEEIKYQEFVTISEIDKRRLHDKAFFKFFIELQTRPIWDGQLEFSDANIYKPLKKYLKGKVENALDPFNYPEMFKKGQRSGTCAIKAVSTTLYYMLCNAFRGASGNEKAAVRCYKKIKYLWQTQALVDIAREIDDQITESQLHLLEDVMDNIARAAEKLYKKKQLTDGELEELHATLIEIKGRLEKTKIVKEEVEPTNPMETKFEKEVTPIKETIEFNESAIGQQNMIKVSHGQRTLRKVDDILRKLAEDDFKNLSSIGQHVVKDYLEQAASDFGVVNRTQFSYDFDGLNNENRKAVQQALLDHFARLICRLPIPSTCTETIWDKIPDSEVVGVMEEVYRLQTILHKIQGLDKWGNSRKHDAEFTTMQYALLAINTHLACRLPEAKLKGYTVNYYDLVHEMKSPHFIIKNPLLQEQLNKIIRYFDPKFSLDSFLKKDTKSALKRQCHALFAYKNIDEYSDDRFVSGRLTVKKGSIAKDETLRYFEQFLEEINGDPEKTKKLYSRGTVTEDCGRFNAKSRPLVPDDSKYDHLAAVICDPWDDDSLLPPAVHILQQSAILCSSTHYGRFDIDKFEKNGKKFILKSKGSEEGGSKRKISIRVTPWDYSWGENLADIKDGYLKSEGISLLVDDQKERIEQNEYMVRQKIQFRQGLDASRKLELLGVNPYAEVARTIEFIKRNVPLLKEKDVQDIIRIHLFRPDRLPFQLKAEPSIAEDMAEALERAIKYYRHLEDVETCLFLAKIGNDFKVFAEKGGFAATMPDYRTVILDEIIPQFKDDLTAKFMAYTTLVSFYEKVDTHEVIKNFEQVKNVAKDVIALSLIRNIHGDLYIPDKYGRDERQEFDPKVRAVQLRMMPLIEKMLYDSEDVKNEILNAMIKVIHPEAKEYKWIGKAPLFISDRYTINIEDGTLIDKDGGQITRLP